MGVEDPLLGLPRIGSHEHHPAMAKPNMRHLHRDGRAAQQHDLVVPVELIGLARREAQRHIGLRHRRSLILPPGAGVATNRIITAVVALAAQRLENPDQSQTFSWRFACVSREKHLQIAAPGTDLGLRLRLPPVTKLRHLRPDDLPDHLAQQVQLPQITLIGLC